MSLNNLYNFKNPVKHFLDVDSIILPNDIASFDITNLSWVEPFNFRVKKHDDKYRILKMPNILNFARAYEQFKDYPNFNDIQSMDKVCKRLSANIDTGDFEEGEYDRQLEDDFERLCVYDNMIKMDIKEYYGRIYTHYLKLPSNDEKFIYNMNLGATNGLIMGNYLSLYLAEKNSTLISNDLKESFEKSFIDCEFSYFSDDFYFFCNKSDNENIVKVFDKVLEEYELERNDSKKEIWTYETFNNYNLVARYWKKLIAHCNIRFKADREDNKLYFINQIVYRMSKLQDDKLKKVFINNFFKTKYFRELELDKYQIKNYDYHQLCFILKFSPEAFLYAIDKFIEMDDFEKKNIEKFLKSRYKEVLQQPFNDEQLYYYYAINILELNDMLKDTTDMVLKSNNQVLISYYLKDKIFGDKDINSLKEKYEEKYWFQNYHLILYSDDLQANLEESIEKYLMPKNAIKVKQKSMYKSFYSDNIKAKISIIRDIVDVNDKIVTYLSLKIQESEAKFEVENNSSIVP
ncbi:RNA-dependent RNA polymerase family protein [Clostridium estertheticum]|uniref:hypothetical protein n=1 Tax=Clostridium estertheticum TaxID=238834 RepID=UPI001CF58730|nr:hypothetical protein [Clostridium estertheticum]MCB2339099.1 hypothetical protein [Clostridium estertheticum]